MKKLIAALILFLHIMSVSGQTEKPDSLLSLAREHLAVMQYSKALKELNKIEEADSLDPVVLYLKSEVYLILGMDKFIDYSEKLINTGHKEYSDIIRVKQSLFLGSSGFKGLYDEMKSKYPENKELDYCLWLYQLGNGEFESCRKSAPALSRDIIFGFAPYLALYYHSWDLDHSLSLQYLDTLEMIAGNFYASKNRPVLSFLSEREADPDKKSGSCDLPFSWCGPGMGFYLIDEKGDSIKVELDTGTGYGLMTIHDIKKGESISGRDVMVVENGIQYNYMDGPRDLHYKESNLTIPEADNFLFGYFDGQFSKADGCASPFVFKNQALHMDPVREKVRLFDRDGLNRYKQENKEIIEVIPYYVRNGWIYVPCTVNGQEVLMMIETGSRNINFNNLSINALNLNSYSSTILWNGKDYPIDKVDCTVEIGRIKYEVSGGLVSEFVLGNWFFGVASAGDIGPDFLRNFTFTIDPFNQEIIFELPPE